VHATVPESEMNLFTPYPTKMQVSTPIIEIIVLLRFFNIVLVFEGYMSPKR
jgi:hypothetical protein